LKYYSLCPFLKIETLTLGLYMMKGTHMKPIRKTIAPVLVLIFLHSVCFAGSDLYPLPEYKDLFTDDSLHFQSSSTVYNTQPASSSEGRSRLNIGFLHKVLGYSTLVLACVAGATGSDKPLHHNAALGATGLGLMTVATGYYEYGDMFDIDEGFSTSNLHITLGALGAVGFAAEAIIASTDSGHGGLGIASAIAMGGATLIIWW